jgi:CheY-like chemotaxis protein
MFRSSGRIGATGPAEYGLGEEAASDRRAPRVCDPGRTLEEEATPPFQILVAEDDEAFLDVIALMLEGDERFTVVGRAHNGREAVELAERVSPDAVVIDVEMPVLDGVEATRQLREMAPGLPIVAVSGHDYEERALEIRSAGADDYVRKARLAAELPRVLAALLTVKRRRARSRR